MSADNWAVCPRCLQQAIAELERTKLAVREAYGKVSIDEWEQLSPVLATDVDEEAVQTFREDYEFYGAETGTLGIEYHGECTKCGLELRVEDKKPFYDGDLTVRESDG